MNNPDIIANAAYEREARHIAREQKQKRDAFLRQRDEEYARLFPQNLKHGHYTSLREW